MCVLKLESDINTHDFITDKKRERERERERENHQIRVIFIFRVFQYLLIDTW